MKSLAAKVSALVVISLLVLLSVVFGFGIQPTSSARPKIGLPQDWSHHYVVFSRNVLSENPALASREPRALHQIIRERAASLHAKLGTGAASTFGQANAATPQRDWSVALGTARVAPGMFPAKFGLDPSATPSCANDFVAFGLNVGGSATQSNMIAFNNLYSGTGGLCGTGAPSVMFSYNVTTVTGGRVGTSPALSLDGKKLVFIETTNLSAVFHVLTWATGTGNGTSPITPVVPGVGNAAALVSIPFGASSVTRSSPWVDYTNDIVYVATNNGRIYKFTGVFNGTPALAGAPWPAVVNPSHILSGPILDQVSNTLIVGDSIGKIYKVSIATATTLASLQVGAQVGTSPGIIDPPLIDSSSGTVFAVSANDGTTAVVVEADIATFTELARGRIGLGSTGGTNMTLFSGAFDNNYFTTPASGTLTVCGTTATTTAPQLYTFGFTGTTLNTTPVSTVNLVPSTRARCSPITEFFNPNVAGGTDFLFLGLSADCFGAATTGCVMSRPSIGAPPTPPHIANGLSGIVVDNTSTLGQASSLYFTNEAAASSAFKFTQNGLN